MFLVCFVAFSFCVSHTKKKVLSIFSECLKQDKSKTSHSFKYFSHLQIFEITLPNTPTLIIDCMQ